MYGIDLEAQDKNWNGEGLPSVGQIVFTQANRQCAVLAIDSTGTVCLSGSINRLFILMYGDYSAIPNPAETAKQKAINELFNLTACTYDNSVIGRDLAFIGNIIEAGYTKSKVKPLPKDWYDLYRNYLDSHQLSVYEWLIENGYCIGSAD